MSRVFSLLHATYGRPEKAVAALRIALERAKLPESVEYIFAINSDDRIGGEILELLKPEFLVPRRVIKVRASDFAGSAPAWDAAAKVSNGTILIQMQDDLELPEHWDEKLIHAIISLGGELRWQHIPFFVAVSDGYRKDALCCTAIMSRARYEQCGEFLHAGYRSVYSDDDATYRALRDARDSKCAFLDARHLTFLHRHHYHDKSVPMDSTYERENSEEAYRIGSALFAARNPEAVTDGLVTWR